MIIYDKKIPLYFGELTVIINNNFQEALGKFKLEFNTQGCDGLSILATSKTRSRFIILLKESTTHNIIAHEALHTTHRVMHEIYHTACFDHDEPECYLHGWIVQEVYNCIKKHNIEVK